MTTAIRIEDLSVAYHKKPVLWDIDLDVPFGTIMGIVGPNGAGKSTLMKAVLGVIKPLTGRVHIQRLANNPHPVAYVPQKESVDWDFPTTVYDVVMMGRYGHIGWFKRPRKLDHEKVQTALKTLSMWSNKDTQIGALSGGQQQRVFLARALVQEADVYFLDEPFQGVDAKTERVMVEVFKTLKAQGKTLVIVHHDLNTVPQYFDHVTLLNVRVFASGLVSDVFTEENILRTYQSDAHQAFWRDGRV